LRDSFVDWEKSIVRPMGAEQAAKMAAT